MLTKYKNIYICGKIFTISGETRLSKPTQKLFIMEKDILIQGLRTRIGEDDAKIISDKTFDGVATEVLPMFADDTKVTDETWKLPVALLKQFAGQKRFDEKNFTEKFKTDYAKEFNTQHEKDVEARISAAVTKALEDYKKEHPENGGGKGNENGGGKDDDLDAKVKNAVAEAIKGLTGEESEFGKLNKTMTTFLQSQQDREKADAKNRVKAELKKHLIDLKANNEACIDDALDDIEYGDSPKFEDLKQSAISAYEKRYKRYYADGGKPFGGKSTEGGGGDTSAFVKDRIDQLKKEATESANYSSELEKTFV